MRILISFAILPFTLSSALAVHELMPPKVLYHGGRGVLEKDVKSKNVPQEDWNKFIVGDGGRFGLSDHRKGLYGGETITDARHWGAEIIKITIKDWCLQKWHVESSEKDKRTTNLKENRELKYWLDQNIDKETQELCIRGDEWSHGGSIGEIDPYLSKCQEVLNDYYSKAKKFIIKDDYISRAWYIRRRDCIEKIEWAVKSSTIKILKASYGPGDVTDKAGEFCKISSKFIGDPAPGELKNFIMEYQCSDADPKSIEIAAPADDQFINLQC